ncbi:MAG: hypothetical protein ACM3MF_00975 [Anaerolineae bacterium]
MGPNNALRHGNSPLHSGLFVLSLLVGLAAAFLCFALFLQTTAVSRLRLALTLAIFLSVTALHYIASVRWLAPRLSTAAGEMRRAAVAAILLAAVFLPLLYRSPEYPRSPLLRPWSEIAVQFELAAGSPPVILRADDVRLVMGRDTLDAGSFQRVGAWAVSGGSLSLSPAQTGSLQWTGNVPDTVTLAIQPPAAEGTITVYWDGVRTALPMHASATSPMAMTRKFDLPWGYNLALFLSAFVIVSWALGVLALFFSSRLTALLSRASPSLLWLGIILCIGLAALTVKWQVDSLQGGTQYLTTTQLMRHENVLTGRAPDPWQYRVLYEVFAEAFVRLYQFLAIPGALAAGFITLRLLQNVAIFLVALGLYRKASGSDALALLGILLLAGSMARAFYDNDLSFNTYFDLLFYLLAGLLLLARRLWAVVIVTFLAALNRETSGLIPFLMAAATIGEGAMPRLRKFIPALISLLVFAAVFVGLRAWFPTRPLYIPYKHAPGIPLLLYNLTRQFTWQQLFATLGLAPLVSVALFPAWPRLWQRFFLVLCPVWFLVHSFASVMAETRLFLVPQALIFIPGVLFGLRYVLDPERRLPAFSFQLGET